MRKLLAMLASMALFIGLCDAQVRSSAITGVVTDSSGAVVPNAIVIVTNQDTNVGSQVETTSVGAYNVPYLPAGRYAVSVQMKGFETYRKTDIVMGTSATVRVDVALTPGSTNSAIEVKADAATMQTESAVVQTAVNQNIIANVPNINDNPLYYATLQAGVVPAPNMTSGNQLGVGASSRQAMSALRINGGTIGSNDVQLDGVSVQGSAWHETTVLPDREALQEVRVISNSFSADLGQGQGQIMMTTKSGTNQFHGSLSYRLRNEDLNANGLYNNQHSIARAKYRLNEGGGTIGGPVILPKVFNGKDKLFFFASFSRMTHADPSTYLAKVPTELERNGNFGQTKIVGDDGSPVAAQIFDPWSAASYQGSTQVFQRSAYPGAVISNVDSYGAKLMQSYPLPNHTPSDAYNANNYFFSGSTPVDRNNLATRLDYHPNNRQSLYVTAGWEGGSSTPPNLWGKNSKFVNMAWPAAISDNNPYASIGDTITLSSTTVIDIRYGLTRVKTKSSYPEGENMEYSAYGMPTAVQNLAPIPGATMSVGNFSGSGNNAGYAKLNSDGWDRKKEAQLNHVITGSITQVRGKWTLKAGAETRVYLGNWQDIYLATPIIGNNGNTGTAQFVDQYGNYSGLNTNPVQRGLDAASAFTGVLGWSLTPGTAPRLALLSRNTSFYTQNDWKVTNKLTINLGLRYEIQPGPTERYNRMASLDLTAANPFAPTGLSNTKAGLGLITFPGQDGRSRNLWNTEWNDIAPRIGAAYRFDNNLVIRGGYGRVFTPSNSGFNANGLIYGTSPYSGGANPIPYGTSNTNATPAGRFEDDTNTQIVTAPGATQSPYIYGNSLSSLGVPFFIRNDFQNGRMDQWNVFLERSFGRAWLVSAGYVGSHGSHLPWGNYSLSGTWALPDSTLKTWRNAWVASSGLSNPASTLVTNPFQSLVGKATGTIGNATISTASSMINYLALSNQTAYTTKAISDYNALQVKVEHSLSNGLQFMASYTWSKNTGTSYSSVGGETEMQSNGVAGSGGIDYRNMSNQHGLLGYDMPNRVVGMVSYLLPTGRGQALDPGNRWLRGIVGGWQVGAVVTVQSGAPWGPNCGTMNGRCNLVSGESSKVPKSLRHWYDGKTSVTLPDGRTITPAAYTYLYWNPDQFTYPVVQMPNGTYQADQYTWGATAPYLGWLRLPTTSYTNLTINRQFAVTEKFRLEFLAEASNLFNQTNFKPGAASNGVGVTLVGNSATNTQVGQNSSVSTGSLGMTFQDPRQVTLSMRMRF